MNPFSILLVLFLAVPIVEIYLLVKVGGVIGAMPTVLLVIFTAVMGAWLLRIQGFATLKRVQQTMAQGQVPAIELMEGLILLICGALLLTPGFFTDAIGFLCLLPMVRRAFILWAIKKWMQPASRPNSHGSNPPTKGPSVIEGEFRRDKD